MFSRKASTCSLSLAANSLTMLATVVALFFAVSLSSALGVSVFLRLVESNQVAGLVCLISHDFLAAHKLHSFFEFSELRGVDGVGELDGELNIEVSSLVAGLVERQAQSLGSHERVRLDDVTLLTFDAHIPAVQVLESEFKASQSFKQSNLLFHQKVRTFSDKNSVFFLNNLNDHITCFDTFFRNFVALAVKSDLFAVLHSLFNGGSQLSLVFFDLLTFAALAAFGRVNHFSFTVAVVALLSGLRVHARS